MKNLDKFQSGIIEGNTGKWEMVIGLEIHAQVLSKSKLLNSTFPCGKHISSISPDPP